MSNHQAGSRVSTATRIPTVGRRRTSDLVRVALVFVIALVLAGVEVAQAQVRGVLLGMSATNSGVDLLHDVGRLARL